MEFNYDNLRELAPQSISDVTIRGIIEANEINKKRENKTTDDHGELITANDLEVLENGFKNDKSELSSRVDLVELFEKSYNAN